MSSQSSTPFSVDRYVVIHVATTCDEHGVYVTKDSAEVIELGWLLLDANTLEEVRKKRMMTATKLFGITIYTKPTTLLLDYS